MSDASNPGPSNATRSRGPARPKVPPFARYQGTSAWRKDRRRVRAYAWFLAQASRARQEPAAPGA